MCLFTQALLRQEINMDIQEATQESDLTVQIYVRPGLLLEPLDAKIATLQQLETDGVLDAVTIQAWPEKVPLTDPTPYSEVVDIFDQFALWADRHDVSITPPFGIRSQSIITSDETRRILSTPMMCLAVYSGQMLTAVYPHGDGNDQYSVTDAIAALRTGDFDRGTADSVPQSAASNTSMRDCPDCTGQLLNVQGLRACRDCPWTERSSPPRISREIDSVAH